MHRVDGPQVGSRCLERIISEIKHVFATGIPHRASEVSGPGTDALALINAAISSGPNTQAPPNLVVLLAGLFSFRIIGSQMVSDTLQQIAVAPGNNDNQVTWETAVEMLFTGFENVGMALRKEDPAALKEVLTTVQRKSKEFASEGVSRTSVLLDTMSNIRNNKPSAALAARDDTVSTLNKWLTTAATKLGGNLDRQLNITWSDVERAETQGRWWLVGAAYQSGDGNIGIRPKDEEDTGVADMDALTKAAIAQGMNTNVRRAVFCVVRLSLIISRGIPNPLST